jgi:hypothetical protein
MAVPGPDEQFQRQALDLGAQHRRAHEHQALMQAAIEDALHRPHRITEIQISGTGVAELGDQRRAIVVALPTGEQLRIHLDGATSRTLGEALSAPFPEAGASA